MGLAINMDIIYLLPTPDNITWRFVLWSALSENLLTWTIY